MNRVKRTSFIFFAAFVFALILPGFATAQEKVIELRYGSTYGPDHPFSTVDKKWIAKIENETKGRVKIKPYWNGTLYSGKDGGIDELKANVVDIAAISPVYSRSGFILAKDMFLFTYGANQETGRRIFNELRAKFPEIDAEYQGIKVLAYASGIDFNLITTKPVRKVADVRGMRLITSGYYAEIFKELGADASNTPVWESYEMLQKRAADGLWGAKEGLKSFRFAEVAKYFTYIGFYRTHNATRAMNLNAWNSLPADIKKVFDNNIDFWGLEVDEFFKGANEAGVEYGKQNGVEFITLPKEELEKFYVPVKKVAARQARILDEKGIPGTKIYEEAQKLIQKYNK